MSNALVPVSDIEKMAAAIAKSNFFGMKTPEQAMALMLIAQAEGKHPASAAQEYHVIQGKPALKADAMLARFQSAGGKVEWKSYTDKVVTGLFSHPQGGAVEITWTLDMAAAAKLTGKDTWKQYPRQMLRARVISEGIRTVYPGVAVGVYTPEEVQDFDNGKTIDITPTIGSITAKQAYGSAKAMKEKWTEIRDALLACHTHAELEGIFTKYKADFITIKSIDEQMYDNLVQIGVQRRNAINESSAEEGGDDAQYKTIDQEIAEREAAFAEPPPFLKREVQF